LIAVGRTSRDVQSIFHTIGIAVGAQITDGVLRIRPGPNDIIPWISAENTSEHAWSGGTIGIDC
jgi:hypothetical protein